MVARQNIMKSRTRTFFFTLGALCLVLLWTGKTPGTRSNTALAPQNVSGVAFRVTLGLGDEDPKDWSG
ncbi:MAG: hypothetical protein DMG08_30080 [Acidobacteria bacterium]|nr:MAG: hypothetical protein DMG08_30080 [Acidobacteriota bacterium]PYV35289.1 MAG: hypothetical protein DMG09_20000 [Acidobacteriota bacterium]